MTTVLERRSQSRVATLRPATAGRLVVLAALCAALPATAQVGYEPSESPYRDIPHRMGPQLDATYIAGGRGVAGVGLTDILLAGVHLEVPFGKIFRGIVGMSYGQGERTVIDPALDPGARALGPEKDDMMLFEGEIQLLITGEKSWNRIAPYLTVGVGLAYGASEPDLEQAGYKFGTKTFVAPGAGVRLYPSSRISIRADFRLILWRLKYPAQYFVPIANQDPVLDLDVPEKEWVRHPSARLAVAWTF